MLEIAQAEQSGGKKADPKAAQEWRTHSVEDRIAYALINGKAEFIEEDIEESRQKYSEPLKIIEGPLMDGMNIVGERFGAGKMFLP